MRFFPLDTPARLEAAARLSLERHGHLRRAQPYLPEKTLPEFLGALGWVSSRGLLLGTGDPLAPKAFFGGFPVEDFRNAGPGVWCPDFAHGWSAGNDPFDALRLLYRELSAGWVEKGRAIHGVGLYAGEDRALEAFSLLGFGRIVVDAASPLGELEDSLKALKGGGRWTVRRAVPSDAPDLSVFSHRLAAHIGAPPVWMPHPRGETPEGWSEWMAGAGNLVLVVEEGGGPVGYLKAGPPQDDVSRAVHDPSTLAICGLWVEPGYREGGAAAALLTALATEARRAGLHLVSVDCETHNLEAYAFWTRRFRPLSWSLERRV